MQASAAGRPSDWASWHVYGRADRPLTEFSHCRFLGGHRHTRAIAEEREVGATEW